MIDTDRPAIFAHIAEKFGEPYTARLAAYGTIQSLAFIDDVGGGLATKWEWENHPEKFNESRRMKNKNDYDHANPYSLRRIADIKAAFKADEEKAKETYRDIFYYYDGMVGTRVSQSIHPAGIIVSPLVLDEEYGVFHKDGERCLIVNMDELHEVGAAKFDFLILKTVTVIRDAYAMMGQKPPRMDQIDWDDQKVWASMAKDANSIFQFESDFAAESMKKFRPKSIYDLSLVTAALRPSGASYRDQLFAHQKHKNPSELIDNLLKDSAGFLVYQEQIIDFLQQVCGLSGSYADTVRRGIARKKPEILEEALPKILEGYCSKSDKPREQAEKECNEFIRVIEDASSYMFSYNHSSAYCLLSYICAYLRYYHPLEWIAAYAQNAANDDDIQTAKTMAKDRKIAMTRPEFGQDNRQYYVDHKHNAISDSICDIKGLGLKDAEAVYQISQKRHYDTFAEVLFEMLMADNALNQSAIYTLIMGDYFKCFGPRGKLLTVFDEFFSGKNKITKNLKQATIDKRMQQLIFDEQYLITDREISLKEQVGFEISHYGAPVLVNPDATGLYAVIAVDTKYSPKLTMYNLSRGTTGMMKVLKPYFQKNPVVAGNIIRLIKWTPKPAFSFANGVRTIKQGQKDLWADAYEIQ